MYNQFASQTVSRARWIAELSAALDEAQVLLSQLIADRIDPAEADLLRIRIVEVRKELHQLQRRGFLPYQPLEAPHLVQPDWRPGGTRPLPTALPHPRTAP